MLQFVDLKKETPQKREISKRKKDFNEIYDEFINAKAKMIISSKMINLIIDAHQLLGIGFN